MRPLAHLMDCVLRGFVATAHLAAGIIVTGFIADIAFSHDTWRFMLAGYLAWPAFALGYALCLRETGG